MGTVSATSLLSFSLANADEKLYGSYAELSGNFSTGRSIGQIDLFIPLLQNEESLLFANIRGSLDNHSSNEINFGLGFRKIISDKVILGGYAFYDRLKSEYNNVFEQLTVGAEIKGERWTIRGNYYRPQSGEKYTGIPIDTTPYLAGHNIYLPSNNNERALEGVDGEVGYEVLLGLSVFAGYYHFGASNTQTIEGPRGRIDWDLFKSFKKNNGFKLSLTVEFTDDNVRGSRGWGGFRLRVPLGSAAKDSHKLSGLEARMSERVERDVDIVTGILKPIPLLKTGQDLYFVNNIKSGDGSFEHPFATLEEAQNASDDNDIIFVYAGDGSSTGYDQGIILQNGQSLIGEYNGLTFLGIQFVTPGARPIVTNAAANSIITMASDTSVSGLHLDGMGVATGGIYGQDVSGDIAVKDMIIVGVVVSDVPNLDIEGHGISFNNTGQTTLFNIQNNEIYDSRRSGINFITEDGASTILIEDNNIYDTESAILMRSENDAATINILNNTLSNNRDQGIGLNACCGEAATTALIQGNIISHNFTWMTREVEGTFKNGTGGVDIRLSSELASTVVINNNIITDNARQGVRVLYSSTDSNITISNNVISDNLFNDTLGRGIFLWDAYGTINIINNEITNHPKGIYTKLTGGALLDLTVIDNQLARNDTAMQIDISNEAMINLSAQNNQFNENDIGVYIKNIPYLHNDTALQVNVDFGGGILGSEGNNSFITLVGGTAFLLDLYSNPDVVVSAQHNWWGRTSGPTGSEVDVIFGHFDASNPLSVAPE
ncbi:MAG: right-handed parallel beta-helix repeat-containing protein [Emcibacter sp.]|nr:right-handed parallel beta-helix repeat-containing protein [Emcibacter sp.]